MDWLPLEVENIIWGFVWEFHRADAVERWRARMNLVDVNAWRDICYDIRSNVPRYTFIVGSEPLRLSVFAPDCNPLGGSGDRGQNVAVIRRARSVTREYLQPI